MPTRPDILTLTNSSVDVLNAIRNSASTKYRDYVPIATANADSIKAIGAIIMDHPSLQNEFLSALINRIGRVLTTSKMYTNPWARFKKGVMEFGETVEEIFVNIAKPLQYDPDNAAATVFQQEKPDVRSAFHILNYQKKYKQTIRRDQLKTAFLSWDGINDLIARIVDQMYTAANYDEFLTMKYLVARHILDGHFDPIAIPQVTAANMKSVVTVVKSTSNQITFPSSKHNIAGVFQHTEKQNQYIIMNATFDAMCDVEVLASAFNMSKAEFDGHRILVDSFGSLDMPRLKELFADDPTFVEFSAEQLALLDDVPAIMIDENWFMVFDNLLEFTEIFNGDGLYWNYFYHTWKTFSVSPFSNAIIYTDTTPEINSVAVSPATVTLAVGMPIQLTAVVDADGFANRTVAWSSSNTAIATVSNTGVVTPKAAGSCTITATSVFDSSVTGTASLTVVGNGVTSVTLNKSTTTIAAGGNETLTATVVATGTAGTGVIWSSEDETIATVTQAGKVTVAADATASDTVDIIATSAYDKTVSDTCTVTVGS